MTPRAFKDEAYAQLARIGKALASPSRIELLELLCQGPRTVEDLVAMTGLAVGNASQHLRHLHGARLVETTKRGLYVEYRIADDQVAGCLAGVRALADARLAEMRQVSESYLRGRAALEPISGGELLQRVRQGEVTVLDVRPVEEYRAGHIPGALSIPIGELKRRLAELPKRKQIVAYCRGPYCVMAIDAVEQLRAAGFRAHRLELGVIDWRARGWRLSTGAGASAGARA